MEADASGCLQWQLLLCVRRGQPEWAPIAIDLVAFDEAFQILGQGDASRLGGSVCLSSDCWVDPALHEHRGGIVRAQTVVTATGDS